MRRAASLFTIVPVGSFLDLTTSDARRAVGWLPWLGLALGVVAASVGGLAAWWAPGAGLLAAALGVGVWVLATGAMHLDGLADTCDGLGSRRPADEALAIMKKSDVGPLGVAAVVFALVLEVAAAGSLRSPAALAAVLALAPMVGRAVVPVATMPGGAAARASGFGALFAGVTPPAHAAGGLLGVLAVCGAGGWGLAALGGPPAAVVVLPVAGALAVGAAAAWGRALRRRFGGITGDLMGAQVEAAQAAFLVVAALGLARG